MMKPADITHPSTRRTAPPPPQTPGATPLLRAARSLGASVTGRLCPHPATPAGSGGSKSRRCKWKTGSADKRTARAVAQKWLRVRTRDIWAAVSPLAPMKTMDRAEDMLMGEKNTFFEFSSPSFFRRLKAKVPFASERVPMMVSLKERF